MICHVVLIRLRPQVNSARASSFLRQAREILGAVPGVRNLRVGKATKADHRLPYCMVMDFDGASDLESYQVHPEHQRFLKEVIGPIVEEKQVYDYQC